MPETLQEYLKRLQSYLGDRDPLKVQAATAKKLEQLIEARAAPEADAAAGSGKMVDWRNRGAPC